MSPRSATASGVVPSAPSLDELEEVAGEGSRISWIRQTTYWLRSFRNEDNSSGLVWYSIE